MTMPGFRAEASLYATHGQYWMVTAARDSTSRVEPQLQGIGLGNLGYSSSCRAACRCCADRNNYFCCRHCRWCSWP
jgi:hypothetical protein